MNRVTNKMLARRYLGSATCEDYVDWAVACLESNLDSKNIRILASLGKPLYPSEVEDYFKRSLKDLGWTLPEPSDCLVDYARSVAQEILSGDIPPREGCRSIYHIAVALDYPPELMGWFFLDEGLQPGSYGDLEGADWDDAIVTEARRLVTETARLNLDDSVL